MNYIDEVKKAKIEELSKDFKLTLNEMISLAHISYKTWCDYTTEEKVCESLANVLGMAIMAISTYKGVMIISDFKSAYNSYLEMYNQFGGNTYWLAYHFYGELLDRMYNLNHNKCLVKSSGIQGFDYEF